jgi:hypothetical protein
MAGGGDGSGFPGRTDAGVSGLLVTVGRLVEILRRSYGVSEVQGSPVARNRKGGAGYRRRSSGSIPARAGLEVEGGWLGELPGGMAKLLRALAGAGMHRSGRPTT